MTEIAFISDIHGNYPALQAVLSDVDNRGITNIVCLGDVVGYYSMINEVIEELRKREIPTIMGNHDYALSFDNGFIERSKTCTDILNRQLKFITSENLDFIKNLPQDYSFVFNNKSFYCVHGGLNDKIDEYLNEADYSYLKKHDFTSDFLVTGHTHKFIWNRIENHCHINPSSVGQPRDNDNRASYLITDGDVVSQIRVKYDIDKIANDMKRLNFEEYIFNGLYTGKKIG